MTVACLVDTTRCIGCRSCQAACKAAHGLRAERTRIVSGVQGYQNPPGCSQSTRTYIAFHELTEEPPEGAPSGPGRVKSVFVKRQCMHCTEFRCADVCAPGVFSRDRSGVVVADAPECIGCVACVDECPFGATAVECWGVETPHLHKCTFCFERLGAEASEPVSVNGRPLSAESLRQRRRRERTPACVTACPAGALKFGDRDGLLAEARRRIAMHPSEYVDHVYGEKELGGLGWLYLAAVPFEKLGLPTRFVPRSGMIEFGSSDRNRNKPRRLLSGLGAVLAGVCWLFRRRDEVRRAEKGVAEK